MSARRARCRSRVAAYTQPTRLDDAPAAHGVGAPRPWSSRHRQRGRGAAAREQPDQALQAALQRAAARRQVVPLHRHPPRPPTGRSSPSIAACATRSNEYFGPFASASAVNRTLYALQRAFPLRSCSDGVFSTRTRPCLQYQIKRCTAPCVGRIDKAEYGAMVDEVRGFLGGRNREVQQALSQRMEQAAVESRIRDAPPCCATASARWPQIQAHQAISPAVDRRSRRLRRPRRGRPGLRPGVLLPRRPEPRQPRLFPEPRPRISTSPTCWRPSSASSTTARPAPQADPDQPRRRRTRAAGERAGADGRPQGRDPPSQARRPEGRCSTRPWSTPARRWRGAWPSAARSASCWKASPRVFELDGAARAHRGLRQQPHPGQRRRSAP